METRLLGIEIGGTKLQIVAGDNVGHILERRRFTVDPAKGAIEIRQQIETALPGLLSQFAPAALGIGFGGPIDWKTGRICRSHHVEGWAEFPLGEWIASQARIPVFVDNDANVAALGEATQGAGNGKNPVFYVTLGSGVGGGLVANGKIYHGAIPGEAELGHVRLDRTGATVESRCSGWAVDARIRALRKKDPAGALGKLVGQAASGEATFLARAVAARDAGAMEILRETAEDLAFGLSHAVHLFHPEVIVLGGGLSLVGEPLRAGVEGALRAFIMEAFVPGPEIRLAALGEDAVPIGALQLATQRTGA